MDSVNILLRKIRRLAGRALVRRVKYANKIRYFQIQQEGGEALDNIEHIEPFGFTSHPLSGAEAIVLGFNGNGSHSVAIVAGDQRYRLEIEEGECAIYNQSGDKVHIKQDRSISVEAATKVVIDTPVVEMTGKLTVAESIAAGDWISSDTYMQAATDIDAGGNITAVGVVMGASLTNTAGSGAMSGDGAMTVSDVISGGISFNTHVHSNGNDGANTGGPQ